MSIILKGDTAEVLQQINGYMLEQYLGESVG